jgi:hypothetical protein
MHEYGLDLPILSPTQLKRLANHETPRKHDPLGRVYFIRCQGYIKIGFSTDIPVVSRSFRLVSHLIYSYSDRRPTLSTPKSSSRNASNI